MTGFNLPPGVGVQGKRNPDGSTTFNLGAVAHQSDGVSPAPFVQVAVKRGHRKRFGKLARVMLSGATVDTSTQRQIERWKGKTLSSGLLLDQLVAYAKKKKFKPSRK